MLERTYLYYVFVKSRIVLDVGQNLIPLRRQVLYVPRIDILHREQSQIT